MLYILAPPKRYRQSDAAAQRDEAGTAEFGGKPQVAALHEAHALQGLVELHREEHAFPFLRRHLLGHEALEDQKITAGAEHPGAIGQGLLAVGQMEHLPEVDE